MEEYGASSPAAVMVKVGLVMITRRAEAWRIRKTTLPGLAGRE